MTFEEALAMVPEFILLRQGVDKWQEGDEVLAYGDRFIKLDFSRYEWSYEAPNSSISESKYMRRFISVDAVVKDGEIGRRKIKRIVMESIARDIQYQSNIPESRRWSHTFGGWLLSQGGNP